ncbi:uncharacterized protein RCH25_043644 [Pelodytes ibericus]
MWSWEASGFSANVVATRLAGLSFWFKVAGFRDITKEFLVRQSLRGWRRGEGDRVGDQRRPVTGALLLGIVHVLPSVCVSTFEAALFRLAFSLAFFGALRVGELVSPSKRRAGGVLFEDVIRESGGLRFRLRRSKTDVLAKGAWVFLREVPGSLVCPVAGFDAYSAVRPTASGPLLLHGDGSSLSRYQFVKVFKLALAALGLDGATFGGHSFRIGAASEASRLGFAEKAIRRIGRWESRRFMSYIRPVGLMEVSSALSSQVLQSGRFGS